MPSEAKALTREQLDRGVELSRLRDAGGGSDCLAIWAAGRLPNIVALLDECERLRDARCTKQWESVVIGLTDIATCNDYNEISKAAVHGVKRIAELEQRIRTLEAQGGSRE